MCFLFLCSFPASRWHLVPTRAGFLDPAERLPSADDRRHDLQQWRAVQHHPERGFRGNYTSESVCVCVRGFPRETRCDNISALVLASRNFKSATNAEIWWHFWEHVITCAKVTVVLAKGWMFANYDPGSGCFCFDCHTFVEFANRESLQIWRVPGGCLIAGRPGTVQPKIKRLSIKYMWS